jgi:hypothetical protein
MRSGVCFGKRAIVEITPKHLKMMAQGGGKVSDRWY